MNKVIPETDWTKLHKKALWAASPTSNSTQPAPASFPLPPNQQSTTEEMATKEVVHAKVVFTDFGDSGTYTGDLSSNLQRHGRGKMVYASGNTFEGEFVNNKMEGDKGIYKWAGELVLLLLDGDMFGFWWSTRY